MATHLSPPYALAFSQNAIVAAGCDKRIIAYGRDGRSFQHFDYSREDDEHEFTVATCSPSGQNVVVGSFDKLVFTKCFMFSYISNEVEEGHLMLCDQWVCFHNYKNRESF